MGAADVLVYIGDLVEVISVSARWLAPGGLLAFSTELMDDAAPEGRQDYRLTSSGRYVHAPSYVSLVTRDAGLVCQTERSVVLRYSGGEPVQGNVFVFTR